MFVPRASGTLRSPVKSCTTRSRLQVRPASGHGSASTKAIVRPSGDSVGQLALPENVICWRLGGAGGEEDRRGRTAAIAATKLAIVASATHLHDRARSGTPAFDGDV